MVKKGKRFQETSREPDSTAEINNNQCKARSKKKKRPKYIIIIIILILCVLGFSIYKLVIWTKDTYNSNKILPELMNSITIEEVSDSERVEMVNPPESKTDEYWDYMSMPLINVNFDELLEKNKDTVGWITVNGTNINYPIVQTTDNNHYLKYAFDGTRNNAGWIFADYRNDMSNFDKNTIIYGHSRVNNTMFGSLKNILRDNWIQDKNNRIIKLSTLKENTMWQVFSVYETPVETYYLTNSFRTDESYKEFLNNIKSRSEFDFGVDVNENDNIITLSTCTNTANDGRVVLHAKLIKKEVKL